MSSQPPNKPVEYYLNLQTREVEVGKTSDWVSRLGPYKTAQEARDALEIAAERNQEFDQDDAQWQATWKDEDEEDDW